MITVDNLINSVLVGDYSELEANILITKYFNNKHFVDFYETFKSKVTYILNDFVLKLSSDEILQIIQEITEFNNIIESRSKIIIPKVYIYSFDEWNTIKHFYKKVGEYECVFNLCGFDTEPVNKEVFKELIYLNDLIKKYISNEWYGFLPICYNEILAPLKNYPVLLNILQNLNKKTCSSIENEIISLSNFNVNNSSLKALQHQQSENPKPELTINQIALKYVYLGKQITRENGNETVKKYGHNSGEKLFQRFTFYSSLANRKGIPNLCTPKKLSNKIKLIESVIELLPTDKQERAIDEVSILKKIYETEYQ